MRAARVTVVVLCVWVCACPRHLTHWNPKTEIPTGSQQYSDRFKFFADFPKNASFKSYGVICLPRAAPASYRFPPHEISFYASVKPIATFSLHRQRPVEDSVRSVGTD